jgi:hypothetical protein
MFEKFHRKSLVATSAALISALGVGGIAIAQNQASTATPPAPSTATPSTPAADTPDAPDTPGAAETPDAADKSGAPETPDAADKADAAGGKDTETNDGPDTDNVQSGDQSGPETPDAATPAAK